MSSQNNDLLQNVALLAQEKLRPLVQKIDREKFYPADFLTELGEIGGFAALGNPNGGLLSQILVIRQIGRICGSTAFMSWCQSACAWYLRQTSNAALRQKYLPNVLSGKQLAGTGMSNTMKHLSGIEKNNLKAIRVAGGYIVNGGLPWVSNLDKTHIFGATAQVNDGYVMFILNCNANGVSLKRSPEFCALEGTGTMTVTVSDVFIADEDVLAQPFEFADYMHKVRAGFLLLQIGIGAGIIDACLDVINESNKTRGEVNSYLEHSSGSLKLRLNKALDEVALLANEVENNNHAILPVLKLREAAAVLGLDASQSAALHAGAKGYLMQNAAQRLNREALFVAIVTPAIKHLRKEIAGIEQKKAA